MAAEAVEDPVLIPLRARLFFFSKLKDFTDATEHDFFKGGPFPACFSLFSFFLLLKYTW